MKRRHSSGDVWRYRAGALALLVRVVTIAGCSRTLHTGTAVDTANLPKPVTLHIANQNERHVDVYILSGDADAHLGTVVAGKTEALVLPSRWIGRATEIRILLAPLGSSEAFFSGPVPVWAGEQIDVQAAPVIGQSRVAPSQP